MTVSYSNFTGRGRGGVLLGDDILKELGGVFEELCIYIYFFCCYHCFQC